MVSLCITLSYLWRIKYIQVGGKKFLYKTYNKQFSLTNKAVEQFFVVYIICNLLKQSWHLLWFNSM